MGMIKMKYVTLLLVLAVIRGLDAATYVVGDSLGWTIPSSGAATYASWASKHTYAPGDILVFNFTAGAHDVATVTKVAYDSCSSTSPISLQQNSPSNITLSTAGAYYFICTFGQHCSLGQKLTLNVTAVSTATPPASPPTASAPQPAAAPIFSPSLPPRAASPIMSPTAFSPTAISPTSASPAPAPGPTVMVNGGPSAPPSSTTATLPGSDSTASPPPPPPSLASKGEVATLAIGLALVVLMGTVVC